MHSDVQNTNTLTHELVQLVYASGWLLDALNTAHGYFAAPWCIAAGAVRNLVWDHLHGLEHKQPPDVDVVFFDPNAKPEHDVWLTAALTHHTPLNWEVVNQAHVHLWPSSAPASSAFQSLEDAMQAWPETATAVGVSLDAARNVRVVAPLGLDDLFAMVLRPSPYLRNRGAFETRRATKQFHKRWPKVRYIYEANAS